MNRIIKILIYTFFVIFVFPSFCNLIISYNDNVRKGKMPIGDLVAQIPRYSYKPVWDFYEGKYREFVPRRR